MGNVLMLHNIFFIIVNIIYCNFKKKNYCLNLSPIISDHINNYEKTYPLGKCLPLKARDKFGFECKNQHLTK